MKNDIRNKIVRRTRMTSSAAAMWSFDKRSYVNGKKDPGTLSLPQFLGIGAQKAGTNWLWENLKCHPDLFLPQEKELHYFNLHFYRSLESYADTFSEGRGRTRGEVTPAYSILPQRKIKYISKIMPEVKLLYVLRNPIDRAWSRAKMYLREQGDGNLDIEKISKWELHRAISHRSSLARGNYIECIDNWLTYYSREQLHICFFDDIIDNPKELLEDIFRFLAVRTNVEWTKFPYQEVITPGVRTSMPHECRQLLAELYGPQIEALRDRFGAKVAHWK